MNKLTYKQAYDKIIQSYFKGEIQPFDHKFCFCGTLCGNKESWANDSFRQRFHFYTFDEYGKMEKALFSPWPAIKWLYNGNIDVDDLSFLIRIEELPDYEDKLFDGMCAALEVLKQIHIERGENVDEDIPAFTKRKLEKVL